MHRFWDILPRAIRFKWKSTVPTTLNKLQRASDQQFDPNDQSLLSPAPPRVCHQLDAQKINCLNTCLPKLLTSSHQQSWGHDPNFCRRSFFQSRTFSIIGWGTIFAIGLQIKKRQWKLQKNSNNSVNSWIQYALPLDKLPIFDFNQKPSYDPFSEFKSEEFPQKKQPEGFSEQKKQEPPDNDDDKFGSVFEKITALNQNIEGINAANRGDFAAAVEHWEKSSVLGYSKSNFNLGLCYETGQGVSKDLTRAMKYYEIAADHDHTEALYNLAMLHLNSQNSTEYSLFPKAKNLLERAAKLGMPEAQTFLGVLYVEGNEDDTNKAVEMFKAAAEKQDTEAFYYLGVCFETGCGVDKDESKAAESFSKAADKGHPEAQYCLANYYEHGLGGLPKDRKLAEELYRKSATAGNEDSQKRLQEILREDSYKPDMILKMTSKVSSYEPVEKVVTQMAALLNKSICSLINPSDMDTNVSFTKNNNNKNDLPEERLNVHLQFMPHCCGKKDHILPVVANPSEVLCS